MRILSIEEGKQAHGGVGELLLGGIAISSIAFYLWCSYNCAFDRFFIPELYIKEEPCGVS